MRAGKSSYCLRQAKKLEPFPVVRRNCLLSTKELLFLIIAKHSRFTRLVKGFCLVGCVRWCTFVPRKSEGHCLLGSMVEQLTCNEQVVGSSPTGGSRGYGLTFFLIGKSKQTLLMWMSSVVMPPTSIEALRGWGCRASTSRVSDIEQNWGVREVTMLGSFVLKG